MSFLYSKGVVHRDLKSGEVMVNYHTNMSFNVMIADFGLSQFIADFADTAFDVF